MKKVVFIRSSNIYDDSRASKEIISLANAGFYVDVIGWNRSGCSQIKCTEVFAKHLYTINFHFYNVQLSKGKSNNIFYLLQWIVWVCKMIIRINPDIIHACDFDSGLPTYLIAIKRKIKYVYDIYDYYVDAHNIPKFLKVIIEKMEISVINKSKLTIICTEERKNQISKSIPNKLIVLHNSPDIDFVPSNESIYDYVYCGTLCNNRLLKEIFTLYEKNTNIKMVIAGDGIYSNLANDLSNKHNNFSYYGSISYNNVLDLESKAKVISAIYDPSIQNHKFSAPNKFYEAMALAKPVIVCKGTGIDEVVRKYQIGLVIDYNVDHFYDALYTLMNDSIRCKEMGSRGRLLYEKSYKWIYMEKILIKEYMNLFL